MDDLGKNYFGSLKNLFPTKMSFVVFISYMGLFINQGNQIEILDKKIFLKITKSIHFV